ncbi:MAG: DUF4301 family protein [Bacteroidales bacterium]|jgi:hypothetical protein|nr:DUF4301 family protein [Bacteroidales bacterium]
MFSSKDLKQIENHGISKDTLEKQLYALQKGVSYCEVIRPADLNDGIEEVSTEANNNFEEAMQGCSLSAFIPASGAATRMFKDLYADFEKLKNDTDYNDFSESTTLFFNNLQKFALYDNLQAHLLKNGVNLSNLLKKKQYLSILEALLAEKSLNYAHIPKGLLPFHKYKNAYRTAVEEHLAQADAIFPKNTVCKLHFTVSEQFMNLFQKQVENFQKQSKREFEITYSIQQPSTDTISLQSNNTPLRDKDGNLLFRQGGHGSLLKNLNAIDADIVYIQNIDNLLVENKRKNVIKHKQLIINLLLNYQKKIFTFIKRLDTTVFDNLMLNEIESFLQKHFYTTFTKGYWLLEIIDRQKYLKFLLDRPLRVCSMVKRTKEPGGGPFWMKNKIGHISRQIVEMSEINTQLPSQQHAVETSHYFNPVDIVCGLKNYKGQKFDLQQFKDNDRFFVSQKNINGKTVKILENPGLWNGAMSDWLSIFVVAPPDTFAPVKTINDLLRKEHIFA